MSRKNLLIAITVIVAVIVGVLSLFACTPQPQTSVANIQSPTLQPTATGIPTSTPTRTQTVTPSPTNTQTLTAKPPTVALAATLNIPTIDIGTLEKNKLLDTMCAVGSGSMLDQANRALDQYKISLLTKDENKLTPAEITVLADSRFNEKIKGIVPYFEIVDYGANTLNGFPKDVSQVLAFRETLLYVGQFTSTLPADAVWAGGQVEDGVVLECHVFVDPTDPQTKPIIGVGNMNQQAKTTDGREFVRQYNYVFPPSGLSVKPGDIVRAAFVVARDVVWAADEKDKGNQLPTFKILSESTITREGKTLREIGIVSSKRLVDWTRDVAKRLFLNQPVHFLKAVTPEK